MNLRTLPWLVLLAFGTALAQTGEFRATNSQEATTAANEMVALTEVAPDARPERAIGASSSDTLAREIRQKLVALPFYTVFDNLSFRLDHGEVTLAGRVTNPIVKADAENAVKQINGVEVVNNQIGVLPVSAEDGKIRLAEYLAIYGQPAFEEYAQREFPPIHIIVDHANVTLEGSVTEPLDKTLAFTQASSVSGVESVTDHLTVQP